MAIDPLKAIEIGKAAGLNLSDCRALAALADDEASAKAIAAQFMPEKPTPITRESLKSMAPADILDAKVRGDLDHLLGRVEAVPDLPDDEDEPNTVPDASQGARSKANTGQLTREALKSMSPEAILVAEREGRLDKIRGRGAWRNG